MWLRRWPAGPVNTRRHRSGPAYIGTRPDCTTHRRPRLHLLFLYRHPLHPRRSQHPCPRLRRRYLFPIIPAAPIHSYGALGDSITAGVYLPDPSKEAYPVLVGKALGYALPSRAAVNAADAGVLGGLHCGFGAAGSISLDHWSTEGKPLQIWWTVVDGASPQAFFTVTVDGITLGSFNTLPPAPIQTHHGANTSVAYAQLSLPAGDHRVQIVTPMGGIAVQAIASVPLTSQPNHTVIVVGDIPNQKLSDPQNTVADQTLYSLGIQANVRDLQDAGLDVRFAADRTIMLGEPDKMFDQVHLTPLGQQHMAEPFITASNLSRFSPRSQVRHIVTIFLV